MMFGVGLVGRPGLGGGQEGGDAAVVDHQAVMFQNRVFGFHRDDPAGVDEAIYRLHAMEFIRWPALIIRKLVPR